jgi:hypothetical protein
MVNPEGKQHQHKRHFPPEGGVVNKTATKRPIHSKMLTRLQCDTQATMRKGQKMESHWADVNYRAAFDTFWKQGTDVSVEWA